MNVFNDAMMREHLPKKVYEEICAYIESLRKDGLSEDDFNRIKKVVWGDYIRSYNDIESYAHTFLTMSFLDINYFDYFDEYMKVTFDDVSKRFIEQFDNEFSVLSVIYPQ